MEDLLLPLFPLALVLFPGELSPLLIFEEHYKKMMGTCLQTADRPQVLAKVVPVFRRCEDGRLDIGRQRFEILRTDH